MTSLTRRLVRAVKGRPVGPGDLVAAERLVRDWLGSSLAGRADPIGRRLTAYGAGSRDLESRVFLAAAHSHVTETDDLHRASVTHPGCVVIPTAWLLSRTQGHDGRTFLRGVLAGYEVMLRVGEALGESHYRLFHNTGTAGVFGSAAAASALLGLDEDGWVWALGSAGTQAAGLWQFNEEGAMSKPLHAGHAAAAGLRSALLAREGFTGPEAILEGARGLFRALCPDAVPEAVLSPAPGWKLLETSIKPYPCCRHTHPAIDAALAVRERLPPERFPTRVHVRSYPAALELTDNPRPRTPHQARFSIQYAVVSALLRGSPGLSAFQGPILEDLRVRGLLERTSVEVDAGLAAAYPERWGAAVEVETQGGPVIEEVRASATGDPERPLSDRALDAKVLELLAWAGFGSPSGRELLRRCRSLLQTGRPFPFPEPTV